MKVEERLLKYVATKSPCDENSESVPTSQCQFDLANVLVEELKDLGVANVQLDDKCFVYGIVPATEGYEKVKKTVSSHTWTQFLSFVKQRSNR